MAGAVTAGWPRQVALVKAMEADAPLIAALRGTVSNPHIYGDGWAPEGALLNYIIFGASPERPIGAFGQRAGVSRLLDNAETLDIYARTRAEAMAIHGHLMRVLDLVPLTVTGFRPVVGRLTKINDFADPSGTAYHVVDRYAALSQAVPV